MLAQLVCLLALSQITPDLSERKIFFNVPPAKEYKVSIDGWFSNSADPALSQPRRIAVRDMISGKEYNQHVFDDCNFSAKHQSFSLYPTCNVLQLNLSHLHSPYNRSADFIGDLSVVIQCDNLKINKMVKLFQRETYFPEITDLFQGDRCWSAKEGELILDSDQSYASCHVDLIPNKSYAICFQYAVALDSNKTYQYQFYYLKYKGYKVERIEEKLKYNGKWNTYKGVIRSDDNSNLVLGFNIKQKEDDTGDVAELHVRNIIFSPIPKQIPPKVTP